MNSCREPAVAGFALLHFQPAHGQPLTIPSSPVSPMKRLLRSDQTLFRDPDVFDFAYMPDHFHHRDARNSPSSSRAPAPGTLKTTTTIRPSTPHRIHAGKHPFEGATAWRPATLPTGVVHRDPQESAVSRGVTARRVCLFCHRFFGADRIRRGFRRVKCRSGETIYVHHTEWD